MLSAANHSPLAGSHAPGQQGGTRNAQKDVRRPGAGAGLLLVAVLVVAGVLLSWGHSYANNQVASQLSAQKIVFPTTSSPEFKILPAANRAQMAKYAGQDMTTGAQAETYANYFIGRHLFLIGGGKTYSQLSGAALAQPKNLALQGQVETVFKGTTLRSMLLEAYGFWQRTDRPDRRHRVLHHRRPDADPVHLRVRPPAAHRPRNRDPADHRHPRPGQRQLSSPQARRITRTAASRPARAGREAACNVWVPLGVMYAHVGDQLIVEGVRPGRASSLACRMATARRLTSLSGWQTALSPSFARSTRPHHPCRSGQPGRTAAIACRGLTCARAERPHNRARTSGSRAAPGCSRSRKERGGSSSGSRCTS